MDFFDRGVGPALWKSDDLVLALARPAGSCGSAMARFLIAARDNFHFYRLIPTTIENLARDHAANN